MSAPTIADTLAFATAAHAGQPYGDEPYVNHVVRVAKRLAEHGEHAVMAGLLHDIVEDCNVEVATLYDMAYPDIVVEAVDSVSQRPGEDYFDMVLRAAAHPLGCLVKLADNLDNTLRLTTLRRTEPQRADRLERKYERAREILVPAVRQHRGGPRSPGSLPEFGPPVPEGALPGVGA